MLQGSWELRRFAGSRYCGRLPVAVDDQTLRALCCSTSASVLRFGWWDGERAQCVPDAADQP